jgi:hypothetical protein
MKNWFKKLIIPSGEKTEMVAYKSWVVRWKSARHDSSMFWYSKEESEIFPSEQDAKRFKEALIDARLLLKDKNFDIKVEENQNRLASLHS